MGRLHARATPDSSRSQDKDRRFGPHLVSTNKQRSNNLEQRWKPWEALCLFPMHAYCLFISRLASEILAALLKGQERGVDETGRQQCFSQRLGSRSVRGLGPEEAACSCRWVASPTVSDNLLE